MYQSLICGITDSNQTQTFAQINYTRCIDFKEAGRSRRWYDIYSYDETGFGYIRDDTPYIDIIKAEKL